MDGQEPKGILAKPVDICISGFSRQNDFISLDYSDSIKRPVST
jgi:hypothetical protein